MSRANVKHGLELSRLTGGKHFVINTAKNGRGPVSYKAANGRRINVWCNPGLRGLGPAPTTDTSHPKVDAYLWVNRPGYGQSCAGQQIAWHPPRALAYARDATDWQNPPRERASATPSVTRSASSASHDDREIWTNDPGTG